MTWHSMQSEKKKQNRNPNLKTSESVVVQFREETIWLERHGNWPQMGRRARTAAAVSAPSARHLASFLF